MPQHAPSLTEDQLREPPAVHLATGMIAAELDLSCADAFERLHERALGDGSLAVVAQKVVSREIPASCDDDARPDPRSVAAGRGRWSINNADDLVSRVGAGRP